VADVQDFYHFFGGTVHNDVRRDDELAGSRYFPGSAKAGKGRQLFNPFDTCLSDIQGNAWVVLLEVFDSRLKLVGRFGCPPNEPHG
jgi:hypothetical protein